MVEERIVYWLLSRHIRHYSNIFRKCWDRTTTAIIIIVIAAIAVIVTAIAIVIGALTTVRAITLKPHH